MKDMEEYNDVKSKILQMLKSENEDNIKIGIELVKSQLKLSLIETVAFLFTNRLVKSSKIDEFLLLTFSVLGFRFGGQNVDISHDWHMSARCTTYFIHAHSGSKLEFKFDTMGMYPSYVLESVDSLLEFCLLGDN